MSVLRPLAAMVVLCAIGISPPLPAEDLEPVPLAGTKPLQRTGDIASDLVAGVDRFLLRKLDESIPRRARHWHRDMTGRQAYEASVAPNRRRLARIVGLRDARVPFGAPRLIDTLQRPALVAEGTGYQVFAVAWPAFGDVRAEGLLLVPTDRAAVADVVAIPDADQTPESLAGLLPGTPAEAQFARRLAESGCRVIVPALVDRKIEQRRRARLTNREYLQRSAYELGRHLVGYELQEVLAAVDWFVADKAKGSPAVGVIGWGEGGLLALYAGALDPRIDAVATSGYFDSRQNLWQEPVDRNVFGLLDQFGDAEIASLVAPRTLIVEAAAAPQMEIPPGLGGAPGRIVTPNLKTVRSEVQRAKSLTTGLKPAGWITLIESGDGDGPAGSPAALAALLKALSTSAALAPSGAAPQLHVDSFDTDARLRRLVHQIDRHNQWLLRESPYVRQKFMSKLKFDSLDAFRKSARWYRDYFYNEVIGRFEDEVLPPNPRTRKCYDEPKWTGYQVVLDVWPDVIAYGLLLVPKDITSGERRPVVVCQHGLEGRAEQTVRGNVRAYWDFGARLADQGFVVFAPQNLYLFGDRFRTLQRKANPLGKTLFSVIVPQHQQITDWLASLPFVDGKRIAFYGISYGGKTAMRVPPLVKNYCLSICSADFDDWVWKNASTRAKYSYVWTGEYEMFEFDLGSTFNYAEMATLIAPRPFMVERGHFDGVASDEAVAYEFAKVRYLYEARLKIGDRCRIEWFSGPHEIHGVGTFDFLHQRLNWPKRQ